MKTIRKGTFESNSSSTHSICISRHTKGRDTLPVKHGCVYIECAEFGWGWAHYNDAYTKACYVATAMRNSDDFTELEWAIKDELGDVTVVIRTDNDFAYIDHQSCGVPPNDRVNIREFIFDRSHILVTGNDNSDAPVGFLRDELQYSKYKVVITDENSTIVDYCNRLTYNEWDENNDILNRSLGDVFTSLAGDLDSKNYSIYWSFENDYVDNIIENMGGELLIGGYRIVKGEQTLVGSKIYKIKINENK